MAETAGRSGGLLDSLRRFASTALEIIHTRIELFATELDEERARIARALWLAVIGTFCLSLGILLAALFLVVLFWDSHRLLVLGMLTGIFLIAGTILCGLVMRALKTMPRIFEASLAELAKDKQQLDSHE